MRRRLPLRGTIGPRHYPTPRIAVPYPEGLLRVPIPEYLPYGLGEVLVLLGLVDSAVQPSG